MTTPKKPKPIPAKDKEPEAEEKDGKEPAKEVEAAAKVAASHPTLKIIIPKKVTPPKGADTLGEMAQEIAGGEAIRQTAQYTAAIAEDQMREIMVVGQIAVQVCGAAAKAEGTTTEDFVYRALDFYARHRENVEKAEKENEELRIRFGLLLRELRDQTYVVEARKAVLLRAVEASVTAGKVISDEMLIGIVKAANLLAVASGGA